jgi:hypothetical protein
MDENGRLVTLYRKRAVLRARADAKRTPLGPFAGADAGAGPVAFDDAGSVLRLYLALHGVVLRAAKGRASEARREGRRESPAAAPEPLAAQVEALQQRVLAKAEALARRVEALAH